MGRSILRTVKNLKKKADSAFSVFIRKRDRGRCYTCGVVKHWKEQQCGHFVSRSHNSTRYDEDNCKCQCVHCNIFLDGNKDVFAYRLVQDYGSNILQELQDKKSVLKSLTVAELDDIIALYEQKARGLNGGN